MPEYAAHDVNKSSKGIIASSRLLTYCMYTFHVLISIDSCTNREKGFYSSKGSIAASDEELCSYGQYDCNYIISRNYCPSISIKYCNVQCSMQFPSSAGKNNHNYLIPVSP